MKQSNPARDQKLGFIFETGRMLHMHMEHALHASETETDSVCDELTLIQLKAAMEVWIHQPLSLSQLAARLNISPSTASSLVDKLVEKDILTRESDPEDRRRVVLQIHPRADAAMNQVNQRFHDAFISIAAKVGDDNVNRWHQVMKQLRVILEQEIRP